MIISLIVSPNEKKEAAWIEGFAIIIVIFISLTIQTISDFQKENEFQELIRVAENRKKVKKILIIFF